MTRMRPPRHAVVRSRSHSRPPRGATPRLRACIASWPRPTSVQRPGRRIAQACFSREPTEPACVANPSGMRPGDWSLLIVSVTAGCPRSMKDSSRPAMCRNWSRRPRSPARRDHGRFPSRRYPNPRSRRPTVLGLTLWPRAARAVASRVVLSQDQEKRRSPTASVAQQQPLQGLAKAWVLLGPALPSAPVPADAWPGA